MNKLADSKMTNLNQQLLAIQKKVQFLKKLAVHISKRKDLLHVTSILRRFEAK